MGTRIPKAPRRVPSQKGHFYQASKTASTETLRSLGSLVKTTKRYDIRKIIKEE